MGAVLVVPLLARQHVEFCLSCELANYHITTILNMIFGRPSHFVSFSFPW